MQKALALFLLLALWCFAGQGAIVYAQEDAADVQENAPYVQERAADVQENAPYVQENAPYVQENAPYVQERAADVQEDAAYAAREKAAQEAAAREAAARENAARENAAREAAARENAAREKTASYDENIPDDEEEDGQTESDFSRYIPDLYSQGDQTITISLGAVFPIVFYNNDKIISHNINPPVGGILSLAYTYFLGAHLFLGLEVGFASAYTLGQNLLFIIPIGVRAGWQFVFRRFEFPLYAVIGMAPQRYLDYGYFGLYLKGAAAAYFRYNPNWSFGLNADWNWYPQWPMKDGKRIPEKDVYANIMGVTLSARYHF